MGWLATRMAFEEPLGARKFHLSVDKLVSTPWRPGWARSDKHLPEKTYAGVWFFDKKDGVS
jgi:hypothetical protein